VRAGRTRNDADAPAGEKENGDGYVARLPGLAPRRAPDDPMCHARARAVRRRAAPLLSLTTRARLSLS